MTSMANRAADAVDPEALVQMVRDATGIPSVTPNERDFANWVHEQMQASSAFVRSRMVECAPGRPNVYGTAGTSSGRSLLLAGHLDTVHVDDWLEHWEGTSKADPFGAHLIDGEIWGRGVTDQKAGICASIEALRAFERAGLRPKGTVSTLFVCDEESGQPGSGVSQGMRSAVQNDLIDVDTDFAIYTEPTTSAIYSAQMGFLIADITVEGVSAYFGKPELGIDALQAGHKLLSRLWEHSAELRTGDAHDLLGDAFLLVTSVRSGGNIAVPGLFEMSLIRKLLPRETLEQAAQSIETIVAAVAAENTVKYEVVFSAPRDHPVGGTPDEINVEHPGVQTLAESIRATTGLPARIEGAPYWSEKPFLRELGIPGVYFAAGDIATCHTPFERLSVDELVSATRTLTHFIAEWCGVEEIPQYPNH